jgi:hypothetical protein
MESICNRGPGGDRRRRGRHRRLHLEGRGRDLGLEVVPVLILLDRQEGGREAVAKAFSRVEAVFSPLEI